MKILFALLFLSSAAFAQTCTITGPAGYSGSIAQCPACLLLCSGSPPPPPPPPPVNGCDASQVSYTGLARLCSGSVSWPQKPSLNFSGDLVDANRLLSGTWGAYTKAAGNTFTINIPSGMYVSFALRATDASHGLQFVSNPTFGSGYFWLSDTPGGGPRGQCVFTSTTNAMLYPFPGYLCSIPLNTNVYVNLSDGQPVAFGVY